MEPCIVAKHIALHTHYFSVADPGRGSGGFDPPPSNLSDETPASGNMALTQSVTSFFQQVKIKQSKRLKLRDVMYNEAKLTWGRTY